MNPKVSIIIPCYNAGVLILEALESIKNCSDITTYEVIIVNDGSTDAETKEALDSIKTQYTIFSQENKGPAAARNYGVKNSRGDYILFLDSDNKLISGYLDKAIALFEQNKSVGVIYTDVVFFGVSTMPRFKPDIYNFEKLLASNYIDMCAMLKKEVWHEVNGLDENRILIGREDWDFWLRVGKTNWQLYYLEERLYQYRIRKESLIDAKNKENNINEVYQYIYAKHVDSLSQLYPKAYNQMLIYQNDQKKPLRSFLKFMMLKFKKNN
jgi:glycosyltransferase involved in cell wall biosynthesis